MARLALFQNYTDTPLEEIANGIFEKYNRCGALLEINSLDRSTRVIAIFEDRNAALHCIGSQLTEHEKGDFDMQLSAWDRTLDNIRGRLPPTDSEDENLVEQLAIEEITGSLLPPEFATQYKLLGQKDVEDVYRANPQLHCVLSTEGAGQVLRILSGIYARDPDDTERLLKDVGVSASDFDMILSNLAKCANSDVPKGKEHLDISRKRIMDESHA